jgi:MotA/TolQ/ExbB proton channel family
MLGRIWYDMGYIRWPLAFSLVVVLLLVAWSATRLFGREASASLSTKAWLDAILFWGAFALVTGVLGTLLGIILAAQSIEMAGSVSTALVWGGIKVALLSSVFGMLILVFAALTWFFLQLRWRLLSSREEAGVA